VDVPLQPAPFFGLGPDQALAGLPQLFDQPDVAEDQPGLRGKVLEELLLGGRELLPGPGDDRQRAQQPALVADGERPLLPEVREVVPGELHR
jgi:hypothetical protein